MNLGPVQIGIVVQYELSVFLLVLGQFNQARSLNENSFKGPEYCRHFFRLDSELFYLVPRLQLT